MIPPATLAWMRRAVGTRDFVVAVNPLAGTSHTNHRVSVDATGGRLELLLRRFTDERLKNDPWYVPLDEVRALQALEGNGLPVPELVAADPDATECDVPALLITWLPGSPPGTAIDRKTFVHALAEPLPAIHRCPLVQRRYEPYFRSDGIAVKDLRPPSWAFDVGVWERAFVVTESEPPDHESRFIHRDYHQGNTVWSGDRLTGIVDWTTGCSGPIGIDLGQMRLNLAWSFDLDLADAFLDAWRGIAADPHAHHPYWEILDAVDWLGDGEPDEDATVDQLRRYEGFVARAVANLGA